MSWAAVCHQCPTEGEGPAIAYGEGHHARTTEADAYKKAFEHVRETGHSAVFVMPGCYYTGDGEMPTELPGIVPPGPARSFDTVLNDVYNRFPEPLNLLLVDLADRNHERWVENDLYADRDRGLQVVREVERTGLTANQQTWAETVASVLDEPHPDYPAFEWPGPEPDRPEVEPDA